MFMTNYRNYKIFSPIPRVGHSRYSDYISTYLHVLKIISIDLAADTKKIEIENINRDA